MNKELIKKFNIMFNKWLDGSELVAKVTNKWSVISTSSSSFWNIETKKVEEIIVNDKFAHIEMAMVDGKTVQYNNPINGWTNLELIRIINRNQLPEDYRVLPEKGDWCILHNNDSEDNYTLARFKEAKLFSRILDRGSMMYFSENGEKYSHMKIIEDGIFYTTELDKPCHIL